VTELLLSSKRRWTGAGPVAVRGRAFRGDDLLAGETLCEHFADATTLDALAEALDALNGFFAVVVDGADGVLLGVDHARSIPLVYAPAADGGSGDEVADENVTGLAGDDVAAVAKRLDGTYDPLAESEFLVSGTVLDDRTLLPDLRTVRPGTAVRLADGVVETARYTDYRPRADVTPDGDAAVGTDVTGSDTAGADVVGADAVDTGARTRLEAAVDAAFDRFAAVVGDRQVALALSGGYDSRLVATELARRDVDLLTYSYGRPDAEDVRVARDVAAALDVPWEFVEYSTERWRAWYCSPERADYVDGAFTYDSIPNYGSLPAVSHLRRRDLLDDDAVCSSGQTVAGLSQHVPREIEGVEPTRSDLIDAILREFARWEWENPAFDDTLRARIDASLSDGGIDSAADALARFERWKWGERHAKYFVADVRQYEFHGLGWWLPLRDRAVVDAWATIPYADRREKRLFRSLVDDRFAAAAGLSGTEATALTVRTTAPTLAGRAVDALAERVVDSPVAPLLRGLYWRLQRRRSEYGDHPLGWYGICPPELFAQLYSGREDVHALQALDTVGRVSFADGTVTDPPRDGVISLPYTGETSSR